MAVTNLVKRIQDIMRNDAGVDGDAQCTCQAKVDMYQTLIKP